MRVKKAAPARITNAGAIRLPKDWGCFGSKAQFARDVVPIAPFSLAQRD